MMQPGSIVPPPVAGNQQQQYQAAIPQQQWLMMPPQQGQQPPLHPQPPQGWAQQPAPAPQQPHYGVSSPASSGSEEIRSLWIGDLQYWMDENYLTSIFSQSGELVSVKIIRNKLNGQSEGYGFLEFRSRAAADNILQSFNGTTMPNAEQPFRLNWATLGAGDKKTDDTPDHTIFVGDLAADVNDYLLQETFKTVYKSVKGAKVVTDKNTGRSKGYGFVRFGDENEQIRAMTEMNGIFCSTRPMRIGAAASKKTGGGQQIQQVPSQNAQGSQGESDPNNTTIFVGGLDSTVTDEHLRHVFAPYGELVHVKIPLGKRCGFVQFSNRVNAEQALSSLNGTQLGGQNIRLSWGRSPSNKQAEQTQWGGAGYYGYPQGYQGYGYAPQPPQDPNMYYGGYPGYTNYQHPQQ